MGLHPMDLSGLETPFSEEEIWDAVKAMPANKSPGPDVLTWDFFKACWATVKVDVVQAVQAFFLAVLALVRPSIVRRRSVCEGLPRDAWVRDIAGELSVDVVAQFFRLWDTVRAFSLNEGVDEFRWKWTADGQFSTRTAYRVFFHGSTGLPGAAQVWNSFAPFKFKFHAWLALRDQCWTADHRLRRGLTSHTLCPLCLVANDTLDHISLQCPFARAIWMGFC
ncbi:hypothetical protein ACQ4PT_013296 [Festuca glaucescens]